VQTHYRLLRSNYCWQYSARPQLSASSYKRN